MTYEQAQKLMDAMTDLVTFSEGHYAQLTKDDTDWEMVDKYSQYIEKAKGTIFDMVQDATTGA